MKIAIDIRKIGKKSTGDESYTYGLVTELAKLEGAKKHRFLLLTDQETAKIKDILGPLPSNFEIYKITPASKLLWTFYSLPRFLKKNPVDVLHVQYISPFHLNRKLKIVTTLHDISFRVNPGHIPLKDSLALRVFIPLALCRVDAVIAVSEFTRREINRYYRYPLEKIFVTYPSANPRLFSDISHEVALKTVNEDYNIETPYIFHISSLQPRKNVPLVIKAFSRLKKKWSNQNTSLTKLKLVIAGQRHGQNYDSNIDSEYERCAHKEDIIFLGYLPFKHLPYLYACAEAFVFPSSYEGFGIPIMEAFASNTPVIISNIGAHLEVAGEAAFYIDLDKSEDRRVKQLEERLEEALTSVKLRKLKIQKGQTQLTSFSWKALAEKTLSVYEMLR